MQELCRIFMMMQLQQDFLNKSKFITKEAENVQRAMERYEKDKCVPGAGIQNEKNYDNSKKDRIRRSLKTYKSKTKRKSNITDNRFVGYAIPFNPKPIKIYSDSSCTSQKYWPSTFSTKGLAISRIRQNLSKIAISKNNENGKSMLTEEEYKNFVLSNINLDGNELTPITHQTSEKDTIEDNQQVYANSETLVKTNSNLKLEPIFKRKELLVSDTPSREHSDAYNNDPIELYGANNFQKSAEGQLNYVAMRYQRLQDEIAQNNWVELPQLGRNESEYNYKENISWDLSRDSYLAKMADRPSIIAEGNKLDTSSRKALEKIGVVTRSTTRRRTNKSKNGSKAPWFLNMYDSEWIVMFGKQNKNYRNKSLRPMSSKPSRKKLNQTKKKWKMPY